jgi:hypothetical protein
MSSQAAAGGGGGAAGQFGDTTFTKVFVGGLAWETHKEGMRAYFEQFGDILEAVVITDKNTGRSKGYGFVSSLYLFFISLQNHTYTLSCLLQTHDFPL